MFEDDDDLSVASLAQYDNVISRVSTDVSGPSGPPSQEAATSLLIYLQLILSTMRNVQRPSAKLVGLQLLQRLGQYSSDDTKLERIVPTTISLLHDQDPLVRASTVQVMTSTLSTIRTIAPSDSKIFPGGTFDQ